MADTLPSIRLPADTWVNLYQALGIQTTPQLVIQNIGQTRIRYHHGQNPPTSADGFLTREPNKPPIETQASPNGLWAYSESADGSINASSLVLLHEWTPNFTSPATITIPATSAAPTGRAVQRNPAQEVPLSTATDTTPPITNIGNGSFEGQIQQWRNSERDYQLIMRSETLPTDTVVVDEISGQTGTLTNFPASQRWVPVLVDGQGYLGGRNDGDYMNGIDTTASRNVSN